MGTVVAIKSLGYPGSSCVSRCTCDELPCPLLTWLANELKTVCPELRDWNKTGNILMVEELRNLLSSMSSPLTVLTSELLSPYILNKITDFLLFELQAARIIQQKESFPDETRADDQSEKEQRVEDHSHELSERHEGEDQREAELQAEWILLLHALDLDPSSQFSHLLDELKTRLARLPRGEMTDPLLNSGLSTDQWMLLGKINGVLSEDYHCRRQMMLKRFQVTLESFAWGDKQEVCREALASVPPLSSLASSSRVSSSLVMAAREDKSYIVPVKSGTSTSIYKTLMGSVPDRGGRPGEIEAPMPVWEGRRAPGNRGGRGGGHHQRHRFSDKKKRGKRE